MGLIRHLEVAQELPGRVSDPVSRFERLTNSNAPGYAGGWLLALIIDFIRFALRQMRVDIFIMARVAVMCSGLIETDTLIGGTSTSAIWLNKDEIWFGILQRKTLNNASIPNTPLLIEAIHAFTAAYNQYAMRFVWRKREVQGSQLRNTIVNLCSYFLQLDTRLTKP